MLFRSLARKWARAREGLQSGESDALSPSYNYIHYINYYINYYIDYYINYINQYINYINYHINYINYIIDCYLDLHLVVKKNYYIIFDNSSLT